MTLLQKLLARGGAVYLEAGQLTIKSNEGKHLPEDWICQYQAQLLKDISTCTGLRVFQYQSYATGRYGRYKASGVTLRYVDLVSGEQHALTFNADLSRGRTTTHGTKGQPLPNGQFRVGNNHAFTLYWQSMGLPLPRRLSAFHECMGKLKSVIVTGVVVSDSKLDKALIKPLSLSCDEIKNALDIKKTPDNYPTRNRQLSDNYPTSTPDKEAAESPDTKGVQTDLSTCANQYELSNKEGTYKGTSFKPIVSNISPQEQSNDEWLNDYDAAS